MPDVDSAGIPASERTRAHATARACTSGSRAPISAGSAQTVTVARPGVGSSAPKMTRAPSTRARPSAPIARSSVPSPFCMQMRTPSPASSGRTSSSIASASYVLTVRKIAPKESSSSVAAVAH